MAKADDEEARRQRRRQSPEYVRAVQLLVELYELIDSPFRVANRAGPKGLLGYKRRRDQFVEVGLAVCRAIAVAVRRE
jgi:hypothetical protein